MARYTGDDAHRENPRPWEDKPDMSLNPEELLMGLECEEELRKLKLAIRLKAYKQHLKSAEKLSMHEYVIHFLCVFMNMDYEEIEEITGLSQNTITTALCRARGKLKQPDLN